MCKNERCIVRSILGDNSHFEKMLFAPRAPKKWNQNSGEWLDSRDISSVMKLFEDKFEETRWNFRKTVWGTLRNPNT